MSDITDFKAEVLLLRKENAKLREQIETLVLYVEADGTRYWVDDDGNQHFDHSAVKDDAAKLRELVRDMLRRYYRPFLAEDADRQLARRAEELGVEV